MPHVLMWFFAILTGWLSDYLISNGKLGILQQRRLFSTIGITIYLFITAEFCKIIILNLFNFTKVIVMLIYQTIIFSTTKLCYINSDLWIRKYFYLNFANLKLLNGLMNNLEFSLIPYIKKNVFGF